MTKVKETANEANANFVQVVKDEVEIPANATKSIYVPKRFNKHSFNKDKEERFDARKNFPEHVVALALLIKNNAEIRRFTSLGILNYLMQKKEVTGSHRYVKFRWNKFAVISDNLVREYSYNEPFFIKALAAAFTSFAHSAQGTIDNYIRQETKGEQGIADVVTNEDILEICDNISKQKEIDVKLEEVDE